MFHVSEDDHEEIIPFFKLYSIMAILKVNVSLYVNTDYKWPNLA